MVEITCLPTWLLGPLRGSYVSSQGPGAREASATGNGPREESTRGNGHPRNRFRVGIAAHLRIRTKRAFFGSPLPPCPITQRTRTN